MTNAQDVPIMEVAHGVWGSVLFFVEHLQTAPSPRQERFAATVMNMWQTLHIVPTSKQIAVVELGSWHPFDRVEWLDAIDHRRLKISSAPDLLSERELVEYDFRDGATITHIRYAGESLWPPTAYEHWLRNDMPLC